MPGFFYFSTMISKAQVKLIQSLKQAQSRREHGMYVVEGVKMVEEVIVSDHEVVAVYATSAWDYDYRGTATVQVIEDWELEKISSLTTPNKVLALVRIPAESKSDNPEKELVLLLDQISDPGNLGTIIRTAEWFGIDRVITSLNSVDFWNSKVVQASMGSVFRLKLNTVDILEYLSQLRNVPVYGTLFDGEDLHKALLSPNGVIVIGNESHGISRQVQAFVNRRLTIKAASVSSSESLNASIATAIVCYEFRKQFPA